MKRVIGFLLLALVTELSAQCPAYPGNWSRKLTNASYTWAFDRGTIADARYTDETQLSIATVESAIASAVSEWTNAANAGGQRITITQIDPPTNYSGAAIQVRFGSVPGTACAETNAKLINLDIGPTWKLPGGSTGTNLTTIVLHGMGHVFLGSGHYDNDANSIMRTLDCGPEAGGLSSCDRQIVLDFYNPSYIVYVKNDFNGGEVRVDGTTYYNIPANGKDFTWRESTFPHSVEAIDGQSYGGYVRRYQFWTLPNQSTNGDNPQPVPKPSNSPVTYTANFLKEFNVTFQNSFAGGGTGGTIKVGGTVRNSPYTAQVQQYSSITGEGLGQGLNYINYTFDHWWDGNTTASRNFTPGDHATYTAYFTGKPQYVTITKAWGPVGTPVQIEWQEHPNTGVTQYQVWRKVKHNGVGSGPTLLTTLNRGTTSYTDPDYLFTDGYTDDMLQYDIRAYYSTEGTYADPNYVTTFGELYKVLAQLNPSQPCPTEYAMASYPNPFNPVTQISFQLPEAAHVTITVYNVNGQRVLQLAEQNLQEGYYHLAWDGKAANGQVLTSGSYFARMVVNPTGGGETRVLTQRMLFMK